MLFCWQEEEQKRLELEMQKRRERIEMWRSERKKTQELTPINIAPPTKKWSLEDDDDDDEENQVKKENDNGEDEIDPLDAYMQVRPGVKRYKHWSIQPRLE